LHASDPIQSNNSYRFFGLLLELFERFSKAGPVQILPIPNIMARASKHKAKSPAECGTHLPARQLAATQMIQENAGEYLLMAAPPT